MLIKPTAPEVVSSDEQEEEEGAVAVDSWHGYLTRNRSIVVDLFQGQLRSALQCLRCHYYRSLKFDPYICACVREDVRSVYLSPLVIAPLPRRVLQARDALLRLPVPAAQRRKKDA